MKTKSFDCYTCQYRRNIPGDCHSECAHPSIQNKWLAVLNPPAELGIQGNAHGIKMGWFIFPINFDPVWLDNCNGYTKNVSE
jgi:hypothetical protein